MNELLIEPFTFGFMQRALIVSVLVGIMCPVLGAYVITRGSAFMGDALAHSVLPGMVGAFIVGISPFFTAIPMAIAVALVTGYLIRKAGVGEDTSIGIIFAGLFALGLTMLTAFDGIRVNLEDILLGQVLAVSQTDVYVTLGLSAFLLVATYALHKEMLFSSFDRTGASVVGLPTDKLEYALLAMLAIVVVLALQAVGIVLVISMLITPAATALLLVRNFQWAMALAVAFGVASAIAGLYISYHFNLPSGPVMALVVAAFFILAVIWTQRLSLLFRRRSPAVHAAVSSQG